MIESKIQYFPQISQKTTFAELSDFKDLIGKCILKEKLSTNHQARITSQPLLPNPYPLLPTHVLPQQRTR